MTIIEMAEPILTANANKINYSYYFRGKNIKIIFQLINCSFLSYNRIANDIFKNFY
jgi:hypothetical protein